MNEQDKTKTQPFKNDKTLHQWSNQDEYKKAIAPSRDGTATRQHKSYLIIKNLDNGKPAVIDFERIKSWNKQSDNLILVEVSLMEFLWLKTMRFKTGKTLFNVFTEVKSCGQKKITTPQVITKKTATLKLSQQEESSKNRIIPEINSSFKIYIANQVVIMFYIKLLL